MLAITIVLFVVPHNQQIVTIRQLFTCRIPLFRNQNLNIQEKSQVKVNKDLAFEYKRQKKRTRQLAIFAGASPTIVAVKVLNF